MKINSRTLGIRNAVERWLLTRNMRRKVFRALSMQGYRVHRKFGEHQFIYDPSEAIGKMLDKFGDVNRDETLDLVRRSLEAKGLKRGGVFLELGANIGTQAVYVGVSCDFDRLVVVEPDPDNFEVLRMNIQINGLADRTTLSEVAVSGEPGTATLQRSRRNSGISTLRTRALDEVYFGAGGPDTLETVDVRLVRGDDLLAELGIAPADIAMVWIDVEGFEPQALAGMPEILSYRPPLFMEYTPAWLSEGERRQIEDILFANYSTIINHQDGSVLTDRDAFRKIDQQGDVFALP